MSLLSVTVKGARYVGVQATQFNTYVTLKLQNVKSTTVTVKGPTPRWEQDFLFEVNDINLGLLVEVWNKGVIWDRAIGYHYLPLTSIAYNEQECGGRWVELEAQLMMRGGAVVGTTGPTGHALLLDCRFEPPFDAEGMGGADLQRKLDLLNGALDAERAEQARRQMQYIAHSGYSEDSDYTSDLNYPVGQHANCSASQFRTAAHQMHTPQRSLEVSRENSYEREEYHMHADTDPLYYNSQPRANRIESWSQMHAQASVESAVSWRTATEWQSAEDQRRPSLERQNTLYDDGMSFGYDGYTTSIRDHTHISQQVSYDEYYDSNSYPYQTQTSYQVEESRQWDSGGRYFYDDGCGLTPTEYENIVNKRRSSVVQLPQVPSKQLPASSRYSDFNGMAPYRPRTRRTAASLPATPSSTPKRGRALPMPPGTAAGSEAGSVRSGRGRRLPQPPAHPHPPLAAPPAHTHVPYVPEPTNALPDAGYAFDGYGYQDTATDQYQDTNYNPSYDEDGMQPFFDETPHATPPAAAQKPPWSESETIPSFTYPVTSEEDSLLISKTVPSTTSYLPITSTQDVFSNHNYQNYNLPYESQQQYEKFDIQEQYLDDRQYPEQQDQYQGNKVDYKLSQQYELQEPPKQEQELDRQRILTNEQLQEQQLQQTDLQKQQYEQQQLQYQQQQLQFQQQQQKFQQHQQQQQQQQKQPAQQLQSTVMTGAATLGSFMAGGAKKLGSLFGAAAAAVAAPTISQPPVTVPVTTAHTSQFSSTITPATPFTSSVTAPTVMSLPEDISSTPVSTLPSTHTLPRTPSLRRQESIQTPSVRRTRTLPDAPEDLPSSSFDESAYEDEYQKTEYDQSTDRDRTSLDRYRDDEYIRDTVQDVEDDRHLPEVASPGLQKNASPTRSVSQARKPSVDSYHSQTPSIVDLKTSQSSFQHEDKLIVLNTQEELIKDKSKVTFHEERTTYHEVPEETDGFHDVDETYEHDNEYRDDHDTYQGRDDEFDEEHAKFDEQKQLHVEEEQYNEEDVFQDSGDRNEDQQLEFQPEQPKLTPKQRWHRAYNKIVMQMNVSTL